MARTTLHLDDRVLAELKARAAQEGRSMQSLANDLLKAGLAPSPAERDFRLELRGWEAEPRPGVDLLDRDVLFDLMDRERS